MITDAQEKTRRSQAQNEEQRKYSEDLIRKIQEVKQ